MSVIILVFLGQSSWSSCREQLQFPLNPELPVVERSNRLDLSLPVTYVDLPIQTREVKGEGAKVIEEQIVTMTPAEARQYDYIFLQMFSCLAIIVKDSQGLIQVGHVWVEVGKYREPENRKRFIERMAEELVQKGGSLEGADVTVVLGKFRRELGKIQGIVDHLSNYKLGSLKVDSTRLRDDVWEIIDEHDIDVLEMFMEVFVSTASGAVTKNDVYDYRTNHLVTTKFDLMYPEKLHRGDEVYEEDFVESPEVPY